MRGPGPGCAGTKQKVPVSSKVESFGFEGCKQSPHGMFALPRRGRAWWGNPKPRRRSRLREQSARALLERLKSHVVLTGRRGGPSWEGMAEDMGSAHAAFLLKFFDDLRRKVPAGK
jgi:hypothetical protein